MTPFTRAPHDPLQAMNHRAVLLAQPPETFKAAFNGRVPNWQEKMAFVEIAVQRLTNFNIWQNDTYVVQISNEAPFIHLDIRRHDGGPCNNWKDFQQIKNELVGTEHEAVELFPAESRLVDAGNQYHLWVHADPSFRFQIGFPNRFVLDKPLSTHDASTGRLVEYAPSADATKVAPLDGAAPGRMMNLRHG